MSYHFNVSNQNCFIGIKLKHFALFLMLVKSYSFQIVEEFEIYLSLADSAAKFASVILDIDVF